MGMFQQTPDALIYIRSDKFTWAGSIADFARDTGLEVPPLPDGVDDRLYHQGVRHALMSNGNVVAGGPVPWEFGDEAIAKVVEYVMNSAWRENDERDAGKKKMASLPRNFIAARMLTDQLTAIDAAKIMAAVLEEAASPESAQGVALFWARLQAQGEGPIDIRKPSYTRGMSLLTTVLGAERTSEIEKAVSALAIHIGELT